MTVQHKRKEDAKSFWRHPITILVLSAMVLPGAIGLSYKTIPAITLMLAQINHDHEILEDQRGHVIEAEADIDTLETEVHCLRDDVDIIKAQLEEQEETNEILRALYFRQTGEEWEGSN